MQATQAEARTAETVEVRCRACDAVNRVLRGRLGEAICGRCKTRLLPREAVEVRDATWKSEVEDSPVPVLVDFWAPWCGPCRVVGPIVEDLARERAGRLKVVKLNIDENPATAARFGVQSIPTLILFRGPVLIDRIVGAQPKSRLAASIDRHLGATAA